MHSKKGGIESANKSKNNRKTAITWRITKKNVSLQDKKDDPPSSLEQRAGRFMFYDEDLQQVVLLDILKVFISRNFQLVGSRLVSNDDAVLVHLQG